MPLAMLAPALAAVSEGEPVRALLGGAAELGAVVEAGGAVLGAGDGDVELGAVELGGIVLGAVELGAVVDGGAVEPGWLAADELDCARAGPARATAAASAA
jgi:hypothetical protein